ncbi:helix-turn-helix domain-containing protein [Flavobacterium restrictum]|uniref:AraC family transcriptional regulator n=1 Tax=Flavobacterium restrictum TaxID=2594428 RepID=A0A553E990_9FLAO|nr:helix-turn-helix domain-containing protein [Flavobacterium restrictum]TRX41545.1 AraC family transcriptional regulator [Flavobacterium restrictum]
MLYNFNFYSSLLLITFTQGIIYSFLLLKKGLETQNKSNYWLSFFVFLCSLYVAPWMLGFAGWYDNQPYRDFMFYTPFQHLFFIGPIIFFYTKSLLNQSFKFTKNQALHLIPGLLYLFYNLIIWIYDKQILKKYYFYENGMDKDFDPWYQTAGQISMVIYFILSIRYYNLYKKLIVQVASNADAILFRWIKNYLICFLIMLLLPSIFDIIAKIVPAIQSYQGSWWFYLAFSLVLYYIAITGYANAVNTKIGFKVSVLDSKPMLLLDSFQDLEEVENAIEIAYEAVGSARLADIELWKQQLETLIQTEKLYENPELSLTDVAIKMRTNTAIISKTINQGFAMNFNDFINTYRIEAVKLKFANGEHKKATLLGIAYDCGFNSKATFNRAFKKNTSYSPKEFLNTI